MRAAEIYAELRTNIINNVYQVRSSLPSFVVVANEAFANRSTSGLGSFGSSTTR